MVPAAGSNIRANIRARIAGPSAASPRFEVRARDFLRAYEHPETGVIIDLHWRLFRNPRLPANACIEQACEDRINLGSERIASFPHRSCCSISARMVHSTAGCISNGWPMFTRGFSVGRFLLQYDRVTEGRRPV